MQCNASLYNTIQHNTLQYNTLKYNTMQYNTIQHNTIQRDRDFIISRPANAVVSNSTGPSTGAMVTECFSDFQWVCDTFINQMT